MGSVSSKQPSAFQSRSNKQKIKSNSRKTEMKSPQKRGLPAQDCIERSGSILSVTESEFEESPFALASKKPIRRAGLLEPIPLNRSTEPSKQQKAKTVFPQKKDRKLSVAAQPLKLERNLTVMSVNSVSSVNETPRPRVESTRIAVKSQARTVKPVEPQNGVNSFGKENRKLSWSKADSVLSPRNETTNRKLQILDRNLTVMSFQTDENVWSPR